jgi:hemerythrin-like domain-containing protein
MNDESRRAFIHVTTAAAAGLLVATCGKQEPPSAAGVASPQGETKRPAGPEVTAVEDLMREHGVMRRALVVYRETASRLRTSAASVPPDALQKTARLFRDFGEDYHERMIEEALLFPAFARAGGPASGLVDPLVAQHRRGREMTDYILAITAAGKVGARAAELARVLERFARMVETHAAREDTTVLPAWKASMTPQELDEMGERFEDVEHRQLGKDGFDDAVQRIAAVEGQLGLSDIARFTAPPPPRT